MPAGRQIDDGQPPVPEADWPVEVPGSIAGLHNVRIATSVYQ